MTDVFRTFCHISEYGEAGYANLHRMIATSSPLVLWAPSSKLVGSPGCRVTEREFVALVERGTVRIIGREWWLTDRARRDDHSWDGASWRPLIDDAIKAIARQDASLPRNARRVVIAEEERGDAWGRAHVAENPVLATLLHETLLAPNAALHFPVGVVEKAKRYSEDPIGLAEHITRDAYNHDAAIAQSGTRTPFLLERRESRFNELLCSVRDASDVEFPAVVPAAELSRSDLAELTSEVLQVLAHLENGAGSGVGKFVRGDGHQLLATWMRNSCESFERTSPTSVRGEVIARLQREFESGRLENSWPEIFGTQDSMAGSVGTSAGIIEAVASELTICGAVGLAAGTYSIGKGLAQRLGYAAVPYTGPQWAFLYAFGRRASGRRHARLQLTLDNLGSSD
ncbi:hypothetical protein [Lentzea albidocapillata]|uniref:Uncharacterized protein n=1 Tax=Lentzea albidocapillata TaxID=40571 RepID=A0A1W2CX78_9PSEU|nr:hypothetical protein [Lentzea albidocapillata]SMC89502.1 hypothetical protein SAMN05660733_02445 [Lentzea albidocapillata]